MAAMTTYMPVTCWISFETVFALSRTTGTVKSFDNKLTLLQAVRHLAQCAPFAQLQTPDIPASSGTIFNFFPLAIP
jgi:hypothetical protein